MSALFLLGLPLLVWVFAIEAVPGGDVAWSRMPRSIVATSMGALLLGVLFVGALRGQGWLPVVRWRQVGEAWELRFANELLGWRTVGTVVPGDVLELTQRDNTPEWGRFVGVKPGSPYPRCVVELSAPGLVTTVHVALPLHRAYVESLQRAMKEDGLDVTLRFRSLVRPLSPYETGAQGIRRNARGGSDD